MIHLRIGFFGAAILTATTYCLLWQRIDPRHHLIMDLICNSQTRVVFALEQESAGKYGVGAMYFIDLFYDSFTRVTAGKRLICSTVCTPTMGRT
jgi:hypothetical protein